MAKEKDIDIALSSTLKKHPNYHPFLSNVIYKNIYHGTNTTNFSYAVREALKDTTQVDFVNYLINEAITIYVAVKQLVDESEDMQARNLDSLFPMFENIKKAVDILKDKENNCIIYYLYNRTELYELIESICAITFKKQFYSKKGLECDTRDNFHHQLEKLATSDPSSKTLRRFLSKEYNAVKNVRNLDINYDAINICQREIIFGNQVKHRHNDYELGGTLFATQDVGRKRSNQEDSVIILEHQGNPNFKLMAVADGMGGHQCGEVASSYTLDRLSDWFNRLSEDFFNYPDQLQEQLEIELKHISKELYKHLGSKKDNLVGGTTFTGAIITKDKTIISSVGDSRAYILHDGELELVTRDESLVWHQLLKEKKGEQPTMEDIDNLRFMANNNLITKCIGDKDIGNVQSTIIDNDSYDKLLIFTDGITDIMSHKEIEFICQTTPPEAITKSIVSYAISHSVTEILAGSNKEVELVSAGKDNASAAAFIRR